MGMDINEAGRDRHAFRIDLAPGRPVDDVSATNHDIVSHLAPPSFDGASRIRLDSYVEKFLHLALLLSSYPKTEQGASDDASPEASLGVLSPISQTLGYAP